MTDKKHTGDYIGRDQKITADNGSVVIGGNVSGSTIITGNQNMVRGQVNVFLPVYQALEARNDLTDTQKSDLKADIQEVEVEVKKAEPDETLIARRLRNIKRMAPDILDVIVSTLAHPLTGFSVVARKVAEQVKASAD